MCPHRSSRRFLPMIAIGTPAYSLVQALTRAATAERVAIVLSPVSVTGTALTIRKFQNHRYTADELVRIGTLSQEVLNVLRQAILDRQNIIFSGGTGTGKTTLLNALAAFIPDEERVALRFAS